MINGLAVRAYDGKTLRRNMCFAAYLECGFGKELTKQKVKPADFLRRGLLPGGDPAIKPSMFGSIRILRSSEQGILVPSSAVIREGNDAYVFVGKGNGRFERRTAQLGRAVDGTLEIVSGVKAGDTIVSEGGLLLRSAGQD